MPILDLSKHPKQWLEKTVKFGAFLQLNCLYLHCVGNKAEEQISKQVFQENKACQIFRKTNISYPLKRPLSYKYPNFEIFLVFPNLLRSKVLSRSAALEASTKFVPLDNQFCSNLFQNVVKFPNILVMIVNFLFLIYSYISKPAEIQLNSATFYFILQFCLYF